MEFVHVPVLFKETIDSLEIKPDGIYADGTLGGAGHSSEIAKRLTKGGRLIGFDQDLEAIEAASKRLEPYKERVQIIHSNFEQMGVILDQLGYPQVDGILLDLGVSSHQLDDASRGFTYRVDAPLDMRMNQEDPLTAADIVNTYEEQELYRIIRDYGEEHFAKSIARHIVQERQNHSIDTTGQLVEIIRASMPVKAQIAAGHPAKRTFQALRIACNRELEVLEHSIDTMIDHLKPGGRLSIITFHSLEDRIVKNAFKNNENPCTCPPNFPVCVCGKTSKGHAVYRKPVLPSAEEMEQNPRAKSAKLRSFEHI
jgi:16S rRNA (cytosine1402-N4)-methyltransferase